MPNDYVMFIHGVSTREIDTPPIYAKILFANHDVTPRLQTLLERLNKKATEQNEVTVLPWRNLAHPGDPLASPLLPLIPEMISNPGDYIEVKDVMTSTPSDWLFFLIKRSFIALAHAGAAHTGYWDRPLVAETVGDLILKSQP